MKKTIGIIFLVIVLLMTGGLFVENNFIRITRYEYAHELITDDLDGYTIVQVTDLHNRNFFGSNQALLDKIAECEPDVILMTGDIVEKEDGDIQNAVEFLSEVSDIAPAFFLKGNHEELMDKALLEELEEVLRAENITLLDQDERTMSVGNTKITVYGYLNPYSTALVDNSENKDNFSIGMVHYAENFENIAGSVELLFAGHTHGGIVRLPFLGGVFAPNQGYFPKYSYGRYELNGTTMIISSGLSSTGSPFRVNNPCEIVCVTLKKSG